MGLALKRISMARNLIRSHDERKRRVNMVRIWGSVLPIVYFFLFSSLMKQYDLQFTPVVYWAFVGGIVFSSSLGIYFDGRLSLRGAALFGAFTLLWLLLGLRYRPSGGAYVVTGLAGYFLLAIIMRRTGGKG